MKYRIYITALLAGSMPGAALAQNSLQNTLGGILDFFDSTIIPFLFSIAFLMLAINVVRYFVLGGSNKDAQENAKNIALYSVAAFVFLGIFWGIVNMLAASTGLQECTQLPSDYVDMNTSNTAAPDCIPAGT